MFAFAKRWHWAAVMIAAAIITVSTTGPASADFAVRVYLDGVQQGADIVWNGVSKDAFGDKKILYSGALIAGNGDEIDISFTSSASNNIPGAQSFGTTARIKIGGVDIGSLDGNLTNHTVQIQASDTDFAFPGLPGIYMHTTGSGTVTNTTDPAQGTASLTVVGEVDKNNVGFGSSFASNPITANFPYGSNFSTSSAGNLISNLTPGTDIALPYSVTDVVTFTLTPGSDFNNAGGVTEVTTPAPAGLALAFCGLSALGGFHWLRRRKK
jgi:hypothetical protein